MTKDVLKLLSEVDSYRKVLLAIIASSKRGGVEHREKLQKRFKDACDFAKDVLDLKNLANQNFHAYIFTIPDSGSEEIFQGKVTEDRL